MERPFSHFPQMADRRQGLKRGRDERDRDDRDSRRPVQPQPQTQPQTHRKEKSVDRDLVRKEARSSNVFCPHLSLSMFSTFPAHALSSQTCPLLLRAFWKLDGHHR